MRKLGALFLILPLLAFFAGFSVVGAKEKSDKPEIPEVDGVYDDPDYPGIKVRVFVHRERPEKGSNPALVCDLLDPDSETVVDKEAWHLPSTWTYNLNPSSVPSSVGGANLPKIVSDGFGGWSNAINAKVTFTKGLDTTVARQAYDLKNIIAWGRTLGSALGVTYIRYYSTSGLVVDVDTIMNKKFTWSWSDTNICAYSNTYDAENIMTHELGHWVGLDDEYDASLYQHATMYGYGSKGEVKKTTLTTGDINGASAIY